MASLNFPPDLAIRPLKSSESARLEDDGSGEDEWGQNSGIGSHGIAGRLWEASLLLNRYLQRSAAGASRSTGFDPPCSLLVEGSGDSKPSRTVLEIGSGVGFAACELGALLRPADLVLMTDLPEVVSLMEDRRERFLTRRPEARARAEVWVRPLAWGENHERVIGDELLARRAHNSDSPATPLVDLVIASDLIYFPSLYAPLMATLLALTAPPFDPPPDIVIAYKSRDLSKEAPFWDLCEASGFDLQPVVDLSTGRTLGADGDDRMGIFIMQRRGLNGVAASEKPRSVTFEDLLFLGMSLHDSEDSSDDEAQA